VTQVLQRLRVAGLLASLGGRVGQGTGITEAVAFSLLAKGWGVVSGLVMVWLITTHLSPEVQGYYYTFAGLMLFQSLVELGFGVVLVQFISHEWAFLRLRGRGSVEGDMGSLSRTASLVRLGILWYCSIAVLFFVIVGGIGYFLLSGRRASPVAWQQPWWLLCGAVSLSILLVPLRCFIEGSDQVGKSQRVALFAGVMSGTAGWIAVASGAGLYTLAIASGVAAVVGYSLFLPLCIPFFELLKLGQRDSLSRISWRDQFWPQQWRIGLSWLSGLLMFQGFVPILFYLHGPIPAGQLGVVMQVYQALNAAASSWLVSVGPRMGILASRKDFSRLRRLVEETVRRSVLACSLFSIATFALVVLLHRYAFQYSERFGDVLTIAVFLTVVAAMQVSNVETAAIRFQKKEPFVVVSVVCAVLVTLSNAVLGKLFALRGVALGFAGVMLILLLPWVHRLYEREMAVGVSADAV